MVPVRLRHSTDTFRPTDAYVRRFWVAAIGSAAVAELLRLVRAAEKGEGVRLPRYLPTLMRADLVRVEEGWLIVVDRVPEVPRTMRWRFPPSLAAEHSQWIGLSADGESRHEDQSHELPDGKRQRDSRSRLPAEE